MSVNEKILPLQVERQMSKDLLQFLEGGQTEALQEPSRKKKVHLTTQLPSGKDCRPSQTRKLLAGNYQVANNFKLFYSRLKTSQSDPTPPSPLLPLYTPSHDDNQTKEV